MARQKQVAVLYAGLKVRDTGFAAGLRKAKNDAMRELRAISGVLTSPLGLLGVGGGLAGVAMLGTQAARVFAANMQKGLERSDQMGKQANRLGLMTDEYSQMSFAARQADVDQEQFADGLTRMKVSIREAATGSKQLREQFQGLGLDVDSLTGRSATDQLMAIADAYNNIADVGQKLDFARSVFGRGSATGFMAMLGEGRQSIVSMLQEARELGLTVDGRDAAKADAANDAMLRTRDIMEGFWNQLSTKAAPSLVQINDLLADLVKSLGGVGRIVNNLIGPLSMLDAGAGANARFLKGQAGALWRTARVIVEPDPRDQYTGRNYISSFVNAGGLRALVDSGYRERLTNAYFSATSYQDSVIQAMNSSASRWYGGGGDGERAAMQMAEAQMMRERRIEQMNAWQKANDEAHKDAQERAVAAEEEREKQARRMLLVLQKQQALYEEHNQVLADRAMMAQEALVGTPVSSLSPFVTGRAMMARFAQFSAADAATIGSGPPPQVRELKEIKSTLERFKEDAVRELTKLVGLPNAANGVQIALPVGG